MFETRALSLLERSLNAASLRQKVIANNIANVSTPNYKRSEVRFEEFLQRELGPATQAVIGQRTDPRHLHIGKTGSGQAMPEVSVDHSTAFNHNNNNVDVEYEMALLAENQLMYNFLSDRANGFFKNMRTAIDRR